MKGSDFNVALTIFYIVYSIADIPSTILMKQVGSLWIAIQMIIFGVVALGTAFIKTYGQLIVTRVLLGAFEAGTLPALVYLLSRVRESSDYFEHSAASYFVSRSIIGEKS